MDWLTKLPGDRSAGGPADAAPTRGVRTRRLDRVHWTRLAAAITFISFLALFPLITVAAAIGAALLSEEQLDKLEDKLAEQVPGHLRPARHRRARRERGHGRPRRRRAAALHRHRLGRLDAGLPARGVGAGRRGRREPRRPQGARTGSSCSASAGPSSPRSPPPTSAPARSAGSADRLGIDARAARRRPAAGRRLRRRRPRRLPAAALRPDPAARRRSRRAAA